MAEQIKKEGYGKILVVGLIALVGVSIYYYALDWVMMEIAQNLPFPYRAE